MKHLMDLAGRVGANEAHTTAVAEAQRDTRAAVDRLSNELRSSVNQLRAEIKQDAANRHIEILRAIKDATPVIVPPPRAAADDPLVRALTSFAEAASEQRKPPSFLVRYWKELLIVSALVGMLMFGAGAQSGGHAADIASRVFLGNN